MNRAIFYHRPTMVSHWIYRYPMTCQSDPGLRILSGKIYPEWLQSALAKLDAYARQTVLPEAEPQTAHMFIINPFTGKDVSLRELFSTHPSTEARIERLEALKHA